jgi:hypothetical protein
MECPSLAELPKAPAGKAGWPWTEESTRLPDTMPDGKPWPKISIVTPHLNQRPFIEETIRSILLQGYPDIEHIIIDGGSTDGSLELIAQYSPWVRCVVEKGEGQSAAANRGFRLVTGDLIGWQNSDDFYGLDSFRQAALAAVEYPDRDVFHGMVFGFQGQNSQPPWLFESCEEFSQERLLNDVCVKNQSMFFRRKIFERGVFLKDRYAFRDGPGVLLAIVPRGISVSSGPVDDWLLPATRKRKEQHIQRAQRPGALYDASRPLPGQAARSPPAAESAGAVETEVPEFILQCTADYLEEACHRTYSSDLSVS